MVTSKFTARQTMFDEVTSNFNDRGAVVLPHSTQTIVAVPTGTSPPVLIRLSRRPHAPTKEYKLQLAIDVFYSSPRVVRVVLPPKTMKGKKYT